MNTLAYLDKLRGEFLKLLPRKTLCNFGKVTSRTRLPENAQRDVPRPRPARVPPLGEGFPTCLEPKLPGNEGYPREKSFSRQGGFPGSGLVKMNEVGVDL